MRTNHLDQGPKAHLELPRPREAAQAIPERSAQCSLLLNPQAHARRRRAHTSTSQPPPPCGSPPAHASRSCSPAAPSPPPRPPPPASRGRTEVISPEAPTLTLGLRFSRFLGPPRASLVLSFSRHPAGIWSDAARAAPSRSSPFSSPSSAHRFFHGE